MAKKNNNTIWIVVGIIAVLIILGGGLSVFTGGDNGGAKLGDACRVDDDCKTPNLCRDICFDKAECPNIADEKIGFGTCQKACYIIVHEQPEDGGRSFCELTQNLCNSPPINSYESLEDCIASGGQKKVA